LDGERMIINVPSIRFGCDPELFLEKKNSKGRYEVIGSERVLKTSLPEKKTEEEITDNWVIKDGVQVELNPPPQGCRQLLCSNIEHSLNMLKEKLAEPEFKDIRPCFKQVVKIKKTELDSLSEDSKKFGCAPSFNVYQPKDDRISKILVDPSTYLYRGGGGHIHLGLTNLTIRIKNDGKTKGYEDKRIYPTIYRNVWEDIKNDLDTLVKLMDLIVGNTCVLIDRDKLNAERRKNYGKAGEYRLPKHGLEYRTLSNFWLRNTLTVNLVMGLSRLAVTVWVNSKIDKTDYAEQILSLVDEQDVINAINNNDEELAKKNFDRIKEYINKNISDNISVPLRKGSIEDFEYFLSKPLKYWFPESATQHWMTKNYHYSHQLKNKKGGEVYVAGFESFLSGIVHVERV
jgi:hypothetical protein